jgi:hypothetical protein
MLAKEIEHGRGGGGHRGGAHPSHLTPVMWILSLRWLRQRKPLPLSSAQTCYHPECWEPAPHQCEGCERYFCDDHGQRGGDHQVQDVGAVYYPEMCEECKGRYL